MYKKKLKLKCMLFASQKNPMSTTRKKKKEGNSCRIWKKKQKKTSRFFSQKKERSVVSENVGQASYKGWLI